jgi:hypothetical protein
MAIGFLSNRLTAAVLAAALSSCAMIVFVSVRTATKRQCGAS